MLPLLLNQWPSILAAQLAGVTLAWVADTLSWRARRAAKIVLAGNFLVLAALMPGILVPSASIKVLLLALVWLLLVTCVQMRQLKIPVAEAMVGALVQQSCFLVALAAGVWCILQKPFNNDLLNSVWCGSAVLFYLLRSLFRPTIAATWQMWRQNFERA